MKYWRTENEKKRRKETGDRSDGRCAGCGTDQHCVCGYHCVRPECTDRCVDTGRSDMELSECRWFAGEGMDSDLEWLVLYRSAEWKDADRMAGAEWLPLLSEYGGRWDRRPDATGLVAGYRWKDVFLQYSAGRRCGAASHRLAVDRWQMLLFRSFRCCEAGAAVCERNDAGRVQCKCCRTVAE